MHAAAGTKAEFKSANRSKMPVAPTDETPENTYPFHVERTECGECHSSIHIRYRCPYVPGYALAAPMLGGMVNGATRNWPVEDPVQRCGLEKYLEIRPLFE